MTKARSILVTGGESGIGAACTDAFAKLGDAVTICYHNDDKEAEACADAVRRDGGQALTVQCDVDDEDSVEQAFAKAEEAFGAVQVAVNSAGMNMSGVDVRDMDLAQWNRLIGTDLTGAFLVSRRFLRGRGDSRDPASLIHISSIHAEAVRAGGADYCAAKGGLRNLMRTLALEEAPRGIRVNAIEPGMILTPMNEHAVDDVKYRHKLEHNIPMLRAGTPEEVAAMAVWLASDAASYVTGASFVVDGGLKQVQATGA